MPRAVYRLDLTEDKIRQQRAQTDEAAKLLEDIRKEAAKACGQMLSASSTGYGMPNGGSAYTIQGAADKAPAAITANMPMALSI